MTTLKRLSNRVIDNCHKIVLLTGVRGSGKDWWAEQLKRSYVKHFVNHLKFAYPIRDEFTKHTGLNLMSDKIYDKWKRESANREALVEYSFNTKRDRGQYYFANKVVEQVERIVEMTETISLNQKLVFIVSDMRFLYEYKALASPKTEVIFCNYKSTRYEVVRDDSAEALAIHLLDNYELNDGANITGIMNELIKNGYDERL